MIFDIQYRHIYRFSTDQRDALRYNRGRVLICRRLKDHKDAKIVFPGSEKRAAMVHAREPSVANCIGFVDGCSIATQCTDEPDAQSSHYNGYYHDTAVNNVFAFAPNGKIIYACLNIPGQLTRYISLLWSYQLLGYPRPIETPLKQRFIYCCEWGPLKNAHVSVCFIIMLLIQAWPLLKFVPISIHNNVMLNIHFHDDRNMLQ